MSEEIKNNAENEAEPRGRNKQKICYDRHGTPLITVSFRCPVKLWEAIDKESEKNYEPITRNILRILSKAYNVK